MPNHRSIIAIALMAAAIVLYGILVELETRVFPVTNEITITKHRPVEGGTIVSGYANKHYECSWRETNWFLGDRYGLNVPLPTARHMGKPRVNGAGVIIWDDIFVPLSSEEIMNNSFANARHACPWFFNLHWTTTHFYR